MSRSLTLVTYLVDDYDVAIDWFTLRLGFALIEDTWLDAEKRWVVVGPAAPMVGARLLLARAATPEQRAVLGQQSGGRVFLFLETDDFDRDYADMSARGIKFLEQPREEAYAKVAIFQDLNGMKWDLLQKRL